MGCDIHVFVEYTPKNVRTDWYPFGSEFRLDRDDYMFGMLVEGVRSSHRYAISARGLPTSMAYNARRFFESDDQSDYHSHSWLTNVEWNLAMVRFYELKGYLMDDYHALTAAVNRLSECNEVRIIMAFDN